MNKGRLLPSLAPEINSFPAFSLVYFARRTAKMTAGLINKVAPASKVSTGCRSLFLPRHACLAIYRTILDWNTSSSHINSTLHTLRPQVLSVLVPVAASAGVIYYFQVGDSVEPCRKPSWPRQLDIVLICPFPPCHPFLLAAAYVASRAHPECERS